MNENKNWLNRKDKRNRVEAEPSRRPAYLVSFALWQITSTARLKARAKAIASQIDALVTKALIIMIRQKTATITVRAFFSVKYFFIAMDFTRDEVASKYKINSRFLFAGFDGRENFFGKIL